GWFSRSNPASTSSDGPKQLGTVTSGSKAFVTGASAGTSSTADDLDGSTSERSPTIHLPTTAGQHLTFRYVFAHSAHSTSADRLVEGIQGARGDRTPGH